MQSFLNLVYQTESTYLLFRMILIMKNNLLKSISYVNFVLVSTSRLRQNKDCG